MSIIASLSRVRVVLVRPSHPGNIGAAARAMKTMGLSRLYLVSPARFPDREADARASNAADVLAGARTCPDLHEALGGTVFQLAFTARNRALSHIALPVGDAMTEVARISGQQEVALVFGNETYGLSNEEVMSCNHSAYIPADPDCSSLNLAAAVQVAAYELRMAAMEVPPGPTYENELASHEETERFFVHLEQSIYASGFLQPDNPRRLMERMRRLFGRAGLEKEEINIWRGMLATWDVLARNRK